MQSEYDSVPNAVRQTVACPKCGKKYDRVMKPQANYGAKVGMDMCPYCGSVNGKSYEFLFRTYKAKQGN